MVAVIGADGFVGAGLASALDAKRIVYGPARNGDVPIGEAAPALSESQVIINAGGFRVRPGCQYRDYRRSHQLAAAAIVPLIPRDACLIHISSASVLGRSNNSALGSAAIPDPDSFPSPAYAKAKLETDDFLTHAAEKHGFRLILIRPAVVYSPQGAGMMDTVLKLARSGITLKMYPAKARHHFCHMKLLAEVICRVAEQERRLAGRRFIVADPYVISNEELFGLVKRYQRVRRMTVPLPVHWLSGALRHSFHSSNPRLDFKTWGEIFGVLNLDTEYDASETFSALGIDRAAYTREKTLEPFIRETLTA